MNCIFNELSLSDKFSSKEEVHNAILNLFDICDKLDDLKFTNETVKILFRDDNSIWNTELADNYTLIDWYSEDTFGDERILLQGLFDSPYENNDYFDFKSYLNIENAFVPLFKNAICNEGLLIANLTYTKGALSLSFATNKAWNNCNIPIQVCYKNGKTENKKVRNITKIEHIECHTEWLLMQHPIIQKWRASKDNLLPRKGKSNALVGNDWQKFTNNTNKSPNKKDEIEKMAKRVASINGWTYDKVLSDINQKKTGSFRLIFKPIKGNLFISVDFRHPARFELLDNHGKHLGEWTFNNEFIERSMDNSGHHDIHLSL